jgi:hypothetical protein
MQIGIDSFAAAISDPATGLTLSPVERMHHLLEEIELADRVGLDVFGIGEHHRAEFLDSAPVVVLSAAATRTERIGDPKTVAKKILYVNEVLGGISRVTFQMGVSTLPHEKMLDAIEILGTVVAPIVRNELGVTPVRA